jgi:NADH:ubiquinone oxidoreductase subunit 4 (subunit M)
MMYPEGYAPRNPVSGLPYSPETAEYIEGMKNENHYKLQLFTSIVRAVIPVYVNDNTKLGIVYFYWFFFMTLLPLYFILTVQGNCK